MVTAQICVYTVATDQEWTYMSTQYVLCGHISAQYALSGQFCWFPHPVWHSVCVS